MANETILVTGATGQVGRRLVPRLLAWREPGDEVRVLVRTEEAAQRFAALGAGAVVGDLTDPAARKRALDGTQVVVNAAATFRGPDATEEAMAAVNRDAAVALAREAGQAGVRRHIHISTNLVYGAGRGRPTREDDALLAGPGSYPGTKREAEEQLERLRAETGFGVVTLRLPFVYGDGDPHIENLRERFAQMPAHQLLPMVHHADVAQAVQRAIHLQGIDGRAYNIAGDLGSTTYELFELIDSPLDPQAVAGRTVADPWFGVVDTTRAFRELGFVPRYPTARAAWREAAL